MSYWTYVKGMIEIYAVGKTQPECRYIIDTVLEHLPYVTGSEENMYVHVIQEDGHTGSCSCNEFGEFMHHRPLKSYFKSYETQSNYMIVIEGHFRDRLFEDTLKELNKWLNRLSKRLWVNDILVKLEGQGKKLVISDMKPYEQMYESYLDDKGNDVPAGDSPWSDYLLWDRAPNSDLPLKLYAKYYDTPEIDAELKRREEWCKKLESELDE